MPPVLAALGDTLAAPAAVTAGATRPMDVARALWRLALLPAALYLALFAAMTWPLLLSFSTHFFADTFDGMQNVWNLWWVNRAVTEMGVSPWYTTLQFAPIGASLVAHTLNPTNGVLATLLLPFFTLAQAHNLVVLFAFTATGVTTFLLCRHVSGAYWPSVVGGGIVTFSSFHFAHAQGHLQLVALQWVPLFLLLWLRLLRSPGAGRAAAAAVALLVVELTDFYYLLYCVMAGAVILAWWTLWTPRHFLARLRRALLSLALFAVLAVALCGPLLAALLLLDQQDPLHEMHDSTANAMDLASAFVPGGYWRFGNLTAFFWDGRPDFSPLEQNVYLGLTLVALVAIAWMRRAALGQARPGLWLSLGLFFLLLALGPRLSVWGQTLPVPMPYTLLELIFPPLRLSGVPVRMMVMVTIAASVLATLALRQLAAGGRLARAAALAAPALLFLEYLPYPIQATDVTPPPFVRALTPEPPGVVLDTVTPSKLGLYYATLHQKPLALGDLSRTPTSVRKRQDELMRLARRGDLERLCGRHTVRYVVLPAFTDLGRGGPLAREIFRDKERVVLDLAPGGACLNVPSSKSEQAPPDLPDGTLVKGPGPAIFLVESGQRREFADWETYLRYGGDSDLGNVRQLSESELVAIPEGRGIPSGSTPR